MQRKNEVTEWPWNQLLLPYAKQFAAKSKSKMRLHRSAVDVLTLCAAEPEAMLKPSPFPGPRAFATIYNSAPEFASSLLAHLRKKWAQLHAKKAGRLLVFMAKNPMMIHPTKGKPFLHPDFRDCGIVNSGLADCEVASAYEKATGEAVSADDVRKARNELVKRSAAIAKTEKALKAKGNIF